MRRPPDFSFHSYLHCFLSFEFHEISAQVLLAVVSGTSCVLGICVSCGTRTRRIGTLRVTGAKSHFVA